MESSFTGEPVEKEFEIGQRMADGSIYAGISPETGWPVYITPADAEAEMTWPEAMAYAKDLWAHGHHDWRLPTLTELEMLYENREALGNFETSKQRHASWYWSSTEEWPNYARMVRFSDGKEQLDTDDGRHRVRCVRP